MPFAPKPLIRFDDDEEVVEVREEPQDAQRVMPHSCEEKLVLVQDGTSYQKCGGGRRRLAKRSN